MTIPAARPERCPLCDRLIAGSVQCRCPSLEAVGTCLLCGFTVRRSSPGLEAALECSSLVIAHREAVHRRPNSPVVLRHRSPASAGAPACGESKPSAEAQDSGRAR